jgi:hypothetical protein
MKEKTEAAKRALEEKQVSQFNDENIHQYSIYKHLRRDKIII